MTDDRRSAAGHRPPPNAAVAAAARHDANLPEPDLEGDRSDPSYASHPRPDRTPGLVAARVAAAIGDAVDKVESAATAVGHAVGATARRFDERPGARVRRVRRQSREPLKLLHDEHPDARSRSPRELGVQTIDVADIAGTAVGGARQRGGDFLPLKPFRSRNWQARWQRLNQAADSLAILPPIDVHKYDDRYWVVDGHNRVAQALYGGQPSLDADVTELVAPGRSQAVPPESFASFVEDSRELRAAVSRATAEPETDEER
jgi:hypothetical protein